MSFETHSHFHLSETLDYGKEVSGVIDRHFMCLSAELIDLASALPLLGWNLSTITVTAESAEAVLTFSGMNETHTMILNVRGCECADGEKYLTDAERQITAPFN